MYVCFQRFSFGDEQKDVHLVYVCIYTSVLRIHLNVGHNSMAMVVEVDNFERRRCHSQENGHDGVRGLRL